MSKLWMALPEFIRTYLSFVGQMWLSIAGVVAIVWGVCLFSLGLGVILGGFCAILVDRAIDMSMAKGGRR